MIKVTPLEKKSIEYVCDFYQPLETGFRGFVVYIWYRHGHALADEQYLYDLFDVDITDGMTYTPASGSLTCDPDLEGPDFQEMELEDQVSISFEFDGDFTEEEERAIEEMWELDDGRDFFNGEDGWFLENRSVYIHGPVTINILDKY